MKLPFSLVPAHWGLKGKARQRAYIEHTMEPSYEKDLALVMLEDYSLISSQPDIEEQRVILNLKKRWNKVSNEDYDYQLLSLEQAISDSERQIKKLELDLKYGKVTDTQHAKGVADAKHEPWVNIVSVDYDPENPSVGSFELDWNKPFIDMLKGNGYSGATDEQIVNEWLSAICKMIAIERYEGIGDFDEQLAEAEVYRTPPQKRQRSKPTKKA